MPFNPKKLVVKRNQRCIVILKAPRRDPKGPLRHPTGALMDPYGALMNSKAPLKLPKRTPKDA